MPWKSIHTRGSRQTSQAWRKCQCLFEDEGTVARAVVFSLALCLCAVLRPPQTSRARNIMPSMLFK